MKVFIFAYSNKACETAGRVAECLGGCGINGAGAGAGADKISCFTIDKYLRPGFSVIGEGCKTSRDFYGKCFEEGDALVSVGSCGIAVRHIAPFIKDKAKDPAVIVIDELGKYVIPILSGHIGGANRLAREIAGKIGAEPVITTATDINGRFSVDTWAAENGFVIGSMKLAKAVSAEILERDVPIVIEEMLMPKSALASEGKGKNLELPSGLVLADSDAESSNGKDAKTGREKPETGIYIGFKTGRCKDEPFANTLHLIPKCLTLGIGCRKGTTKKKIAEAVKAVFDEAGLDLRAVKEAASIDIKKDESGLLEYCSDFGVPVRFYSADELSNAKGEFSASEFVKNVTGVDNVCERAAIIASDRIIVKKTAFDGVTVAVGLEDKEVLF